MKKSLLLALLVAVMQLALKAENYELDLPKSIEIAKSRSIKMAKLSEELQIANYNLKAATSSMKTHIDMNFTAPNYSKSIEKFTTDTSVTLYSNETLNYGGNLVVRQPLPTAGSLYFNTGLYNDDYFHIKTRNPTLRSYLGFSQPLNALYAYNEVSSRLKMAKLSFESSRQQYKRQELDLIYEVSSAFYNLISVQKASDIAKLNLERQQEAFDTNKKKYEAGLIKEVDALKMEVDLDQARNDYDLSLLNQESVENAFKNIIGIAINDSVVLKTEYKYEKLIVDPDKAVQLALQNRLEIREQQIQIEQGKLNIKQQKSQGMIQSELNMSVGKNRTEKRSLNTSLPVAIEDLYSNYMDSPTTYGVGLTIKVPLVDWGENRARVRIAQSRLKQSQLNQEEIKRAIEQEVRNLVADLNSSLKRLQVLEKTVAVAEKSFEITRQRFAEGEVSSEEMTMERTRLNTSYNSHLSAYSTYQLKLADLARKTFYDFKNNMPIK